MKVFKNKVDLQQELNPCFDLNKNVGFVPTMGALHQGHLSLVEKALVDNDCVVVSIFVNPTQFDKPADLEKYPRLLEEDVKLLNSIGGDIIVFAPEAAHLYNNDVSSKFYHFSGLEFEMEGRHRAGHFDGVGTVLNLLFRIIKPNTAYFGQKDFQQLQIVKKLVEIEKIPITIVGCPILREKNGVAMSSRNRRLSPDQLNQASLIYKTLKEVQKKFEYTSIPKLKTFVNTVFAENPAFELEYFEIADVNTLKSAERKRKTNTYRAFIAAWIGGVRLIDNIALN
jgi:pantoate--beta-alanine ligase